MKQTRSEIKLGGLFGAFFVALQLFFASPLYAQKPEIRSIDKIIAPNGEVVSITGENFGTNPVNIAVFFGAVRGTINSIADQRIEVQVPSGTTFDNISVTNITTGLTGYSRGHFLLSFGGPHPFSASNLAPQVDFNTEKGLYDLCLCDFNGDKKVDVGTASRTASTVKVLPNNSPGAGTISFNTAAPSQIVGNGSLHSTCGDLDGDGKPDLVLTEDQGTRLFIFRNTSSGIISFTQDYKTITLEPNNNIKQVKIADLDLDGKPELIVSNQQKAVVFVLVNQSIVGDIEFADPIIKIVSSNINDGMDGLDVGDLDGDGFPEIVTSRFLSAGNMSIIKNTSIRGTVSLGAITAIPIAASTNLKLADLDGDGKKDIIVARFGNNSLSIFLNQSTNGTLTFPATGEIITTEEKPYGLDVGDLDGDGKPDIVVASLTKSKIQVFNNESTLGNLAFQIQNINTTEWIRHVKVGDLDNDGKPDIAFTTIDERNPSVLTPKISVFRNRTCMVPEITPEGPLSICTGFPLQLTTAKSNGVTYEWRNLTSGMVVKSGPDAFYDVTASGEYQVTALAEGGTCAEVSNKVTVTVGTSSGLPLAAIKPAGPICVGSTLQLELTADVGGTYKWTGPNGYTGTGATPTPITNFKEANAGRYYLDVYDGTCITQQTSIVVLAIDIGNFTVNPATAVICQGGNKTLTVSPVIASASYQWFETTDGPLTSDSPSNTSHVVSDAGSYYVKVTYPGCTPAETNRATMTVATVPVANFTVATEACAGQAVLFTNTSTHDPAFTPIYAWEFGDNTTSSEQNPTHTYVTPGSVSATLTVSYTGGACADETNPPKSITITSAPVPSITNTEGKYSLCAGENLTLQVTGGSYNSYAWNTGATDPSIVVTESGTYSVVVTTSSCTLNASKNIGSLQAPQVIVQADPPTINEGQSSQLSAEGLLDFEWSPVETLSDYTISNPVASPVFTTSYTVTGTGLNGCQGTGTVELKVITDAIVTKLSPKSFFSPNNDESNPVWKVENILDFPQCNIAIYDDKGIKVYEAKPYLNDWDGTFNGKKLPQGVYFYIIKCDGEESKPKAGSITILR